jgi:hypothetical protein
MCYPSAEAKEGLPLPSKLSHLGVIAPAFLSLAIVAQPTRSVCPAPPHVLTLSQPNIFSEQQEQWLGDAMADQIERRYKIIQDPAENAYLSHITARLLTALPPTTIQFRVVLVDMPVVNAFSIAGGRVYISRKLVVNAKNEDEVASVLGHEMGHILSHQFAIRFTSDLNRLLGVTSVGDKADIYDKFQRLIDASMRDKHPFQSGNSDEKQDEADTVSVYAVAAAGYRPQAFSEFWDRMFFVDGKVGGSLSDFLGVTRPEEKRLRAILKLVNALPAGCGSSLPTDPPEFQQWQALVNANQPTVTQANFTPAAQVALNPPLRMSLEHLRFSRDGKYIFAQDESSIFVLTREPFQQSFRFDAEGALPAEFSPDSQNIVFTTPGLHTERWSVQDHKLVSSHDPLTRSRCIQNKLSPDGRTLFCLSVRQQMLGPSLLDFSMLDVDTGNVLFKREDFFTPTLGYAIALNLATMFSLPADLMPSSISADGNTILIGPSINKLAFDLRTRTPIKISKGLVDSVNGAYAFIGNDKVAGEAKAVSDSGIFSFPDGKRLQAVPFALSDLSSVSSGDYVVSHDVKDYAVGLVETSDAKFVLASKAASIDVWDGSMVNENADGSIILHRIGDKNVPDQTALLPISPLGPSLVTSTSRDGRFVAISTRTRGGVWDLSTGERLLLAHHFNSAVFAPDDSLYTDFPKSGKEERAIVHFSFAPFTATPVTYTVDKSTALTHSGLQEWKQSEDKKTVEVIVHEVADNSVLWRRTFDQAGFAHTSSGIVANQIIVAFLLKSDFAKSRIGADPALAAQAAQIQNRDKAGLVQVLDGRNGNVLHEAVLEIPLDYEGLQGMHAVGDLLLLTGRANRTLTYSLKSGAQLRQVFGSLIAADQSSGRICLLNRRDEVLVYDADGRELGDFYMGSPLRFAAFSQNADRLLALTADQKVETIELTQTTTVGSTTP